MLTKERVEEITAYFADKAGYTFKNNALLIQALTRPSAKGIHVPKDAPDFERLEFVGDRILNTVIADHLAELHPTATPSTLHQYFIEYTRNADASKKNGGPLYRVAKAIQLEAFIIKDEAEDLEHYANRGKLRGAKESKEEHLSDHLEAFIGAMYQDSNRDMQIMSDWIKNYWQFMGLNEDQLSESSFGASVISHTATAIQEKIRQDNLLLQSASAGNFDKFLDAIKNGASIETKDKKGRNALHLFAIFGHKKAIEHILISSALDVNMTDDENFTALYYAAERGKAECVETLLENHASIHINLGEGIATSIIMHAASFRHVPVVSLLLKYQWHAVYPKELESCLKYIKENKLQAMGPHLTNAFAAIKPNERMFTAAASIIKNPQTTGANTATVIQAIQDGANIYAKDTEGRSIFTLLKLMPVEPRFEILAYILRTAKKIRLGEMDLNDISADVTPAHTNTIAPAYNLLVDISNNNQDDVDIIGTIQDWLNEIDDAITPPQKTAQAPAPHKSVSKAASIHYALPSQSSSSSSKPTSSSLNL